MVFIDLDIKGQFRSIQHKLNKLLLDCFNMKEECTVGIYVCERERENKIEEERVRERERERFKCI